MTDKMPKHIAIVMDGNGRWAEAQGLSRNAGHKAGVQTVRTIVEACAKKGVEALTLFTFGLENQKRPKLEVKLLMELFLSALKKYLKELEGHQVRFRVIGDYHLAGKKVAAEIEASMARTVNNTGMTLNLAFFYSGRWDLTNACQQLIADGTTEVTEDLLAKKLALADLPEPDLFIRTSGAQRLSNFLLWQLAYTELYFAELHWPAFTEEELDKAIHYFQGVTRKFGKTAQQLLEEE